ERRPLVRQTRAGGGPEWQGMRWATAGAGEGAATPPLRPRARVGTDPHSWLEPAALISRRRAGWARAKRSQRGERAQAPWQSPPWGWSAAPLPALATYGHSSPIGVARQAWAARSATRLRWPQAPWPP